LTFPDIVCGISEPGKSGKEQTERWMDRPPYPGAPTWAKSLGLAAAALILLAFVLALTGHGSIGRHLHPPGSSAAVESRR
jgi:hypothetical protein